MNLTRVRLQKQINSKNKQTRKIFKKNVKVLKHVNTVRNRKVFNLKNNSLKNWASS
jgi:hypothetical protein